FHTPLQPRSLGSHDVTQLAHHYTKQTQTREDSTSAVVYRKPLTETSVFLAEVQALHLKPEFRLKQMHNNFEEWIKMATETQPFKQLGTRFDVLLSPDELSKDRDTTNFQKTSCTTRWMCKDIYTLRVDSVATETERPLGGLADSTCHRIDYERKEDSNQTEESEDQDPQTKQRRKKTLAKDPSAICVKDWDLERQVDSLWKKMAVDAERRIVFDTSEAVVGDGSESAGIEMDMTKLVCEFHIYT
ncbi:9699_t:CDS:2, partial [Paraglomus occultum]